MFGNLGGINPGQMKAMMKQLGIQQETLVAKRVIIEQADGRIVIDDPTVEKMVMKGQESWQIVGKARVEHMSVSFSDEDVALVVEQTGKSEKDVRASLAQTHDLAETISQLSA